MRPSRITFSTGLSAGARVVSSRMTKTSRSGRPLASASDQPVSASATGFMKLTAPVVVGGDDRVADAAQRGGQPLAADADLLGVGAQRALELAAAADVAIDGEEDERQHDDQDAGRAFDAERDPKAGLRLFFVPRPQRVLVGAQLGDQRARAIHELLAFAALDARHRLVALAGPGELDGGCELGELAIGDALELGDALALRRTLDGELLEPRAELGPAGAHALERLEVALVAGQDVAALRRLGVEQAVEQIAQHPTRREGAIDLGARALEARQRDDVGDHERREQRRHEQRDRSRAGESRARHERTL